MTRQVTLQLAGVGLIGVPTAIRDCKALTLLDLRDNALVVSPEPLLV